MKRFYNLQYEKTGLKGPLKEYHYNPIDTNDILDMHRYLMKET